MTLAALISGVLAVASPLAAQKPTKATVDVVIRDRADAPVAGVTVEIAPMDGPKRTAVTDSAGKVTIGDLAPGTAWVHTRKPGIEAGDLRAVLGLGANTLPLFVDPVAKTFLAEVRIVGGREMASRHAEFEWRRAAGLTTASLTEDDIAKRKPVASWEMLRAIPAVSVETSSLEQAYAKSTRSNCYYRLMVDQVERKGINGAPPDMADMPAPGLIHGIEVFASQSSIPGQYLSSGGSALDLSTGTATFGTDNSVQQPTNRMAPTCGLIMVWTK